LRAPYRQLIKLGVIFAELCTLAMFYSATMLDPLPFDWVRVTSILSTGLISCALAYLASDPLQDPAKASDLTRKRMLLKPPFLIWIAVVVVTIAQLASDLMMLYLANHR
jgi:hypothetical protein